MNKLTAVFSTFVLGSAFIVSAHAGVLPTEVADLTFMVQEEKLAHDIYVKLGKKYSAQPFLNIPKSEQRHMDAIGRLLAGFSISNPNDGKAAGEFEDQTLQKLYTDLVNQGLTNEFAAFSVGGLIEEKDIEDLRLAMKRTQNPAILLAYESLDCGSRNHLRAFSKFSERASGKPYVAQVLPQKEVDQIINSPHERCGNGKMRFAK